MESGTQQNKWVSSRPSFSSQSTTAEIIMMMTMMMTMMMSTMTMMMVMVMVIVINIIKLNIMGECSNERWSFHFEIISQNTFNFIFIMLRTSISYYKYCIFHDFGILDLRTTEPFRSDSRTFFSNLRAFGLKEPSDS